MPISKVHSLRLKEVKRTCLSLLRSEGFVAVSSRRAVITSNFAQAKEQCAIPKQRAMSPRTSGRIGLRREKTSPKATESPDRDPDCRTSETECIQRWPAIQNVLEGHTSWFNGRSTVTDSIPSNVESIPKSHQSCLFSFSTCISIVCQLYYLLVYNQVLSRVSNRFSGYW